jgi:hypothetical protein
MRDVGRKDVLEVASADDEEPVEALAGSADPAFGEGFAFVARSGVWMISTPIGCRN